MNLSRARLCVGLRWFAFSLATFAAVAPVRPADAGAAAAHRETPIVLAVRRARPAVVNISSEKTVLGKNGWNNNDAGEPQRVNGMGSGVIIDERGYIVTNFHVVDRVNVLRVRLADGSTYEATVVDRDRNEDLALLKIDAGRPLPVIPMGTSSDLMIGETVIAVGNAFGYENTVTTGIVSATGRTVPLNSEITYYDLIQTNASINPGNSGGALLNIDGELVGVNVAIRAGAQGISFAIPIDKMRRIAADMVSIQKINRTWHGMQLADPTDPTVPSAGVTVQKSDGPAQKSGLRIGDRLVQVGDAKISSRLDFERSLLGAKPGDRAAVIVRRGGSQETIELTIEEMPKPPESPTELVWRRLGLRLSSVEPNQVQRFQAQLHGGMYVAQVQSNSPAAAAGIRTGDVLLGLGKWETLNYDNVLFVLTQSESTTTEALAAHVLRNGERRSLDLRLATIVREAVKSR